MTDLTDLLAKWRRIAEQRTTCGDGKLAEVEKGTFAFWASTPEHRERWGAEQDAAFINLSYALLPALLDVAEAAAQDTQHYAEGYCARINKALARLAEVGRE